MSNNDYQIPKNEYVVFDSTTIQEFLKNKLNDSNIFTDQKYAGSYISQIIDLIAMMFNYLMFYLNRTSTETMFSETQIYENMNRIVKLLDYKPVGKQSAILSFEATAKALLPIGVYLIPR